MQNVSAKIYIFFVAAVIIGLSSGFIARGLVGNENFDKLYAKKEALSMTGELRILFGNNAFENWEANIEGRVVSNDGRILTIERDGKMFALRLTSVSNIEKQNLDEANMSAFEKQISVRDINKGDSISANVVFYDGEPEIVNLLVKAREIFIYEGTILALDSGGMEFKGSDGNILNIKFDSHTSFQRLSDIISNGEVVYVAGALNDFSVGDKIEIEVYSYGSENYAGYIFPEKK